MQTNVFGEPLKTCGEEPLTGFNRSGCCDSSEYDPGLHIVCAVMTNEFLNFTNLRGNDLMTPNPETGFPGLKAGDRWCLCASRWLEAYEAGVAPPVVLESTNEIILEFLPLDELVLFAHLEYGNDL